MIYSKICVSFFGEMGLERESEIQMRFARTAIEANFDYLNRRFLENKEGRDFKIPPRIIDIHLGYKGRPCQNKCVWCYDKRDDNRKILRFNNEQIEELKSEIDRIVDWEREEFEVEEIYLAGGGEPTLFPEVTSLIMDRFSQEERNVWLTTNGIFLSDRLTTSVKKIKGVLVSLNGCDKESYLANTKFDGFSVVMDNLRRLLDLRKKEGFPLRVNVTYVFNPNNINSLRKLILELNDMGLDEFRCRYDLFSKPDEPYNIEGKEVLEQIVLDYPNLPMEVVLKSPPSESLPENYECYAPFIWPTWNPLHGIFPCAHTTNEYNRIASKIRSGVYLLTETTGEQGDMLRPQCTRRCPSRLHWFNLFFNDRSFMKFPPTTIIAEE